MVRPSCPGPTPGPPVHLRQPRLRRGHVRWAGGADRPPGTSAARPGLRSLLERVVLALADRAGSGWPAYWARSCPGCTLIRLIRALPDPGIGTVAVPGADDRARRRGQSYASVLPGMDTHRVTGILPGREAGTFAQWLRAHPGVRLICRDRADGFALGGREGAPGAQQVADRWHMRDDLGDYMKKAAAAHHGCIKDHYAVLNQTAAEQATDPQRTAGQATAEHAGNRGGTGRRGPLKAGERELPDPGQARRRRGVRDLPHGRGSDRRAASRHGVPAGTRGALWPGQRGRPGVAPPADSQMRSSSRWFREPVTPSRPVLAPMSDGSDRQSRILGPFRMGWHLAGAQLSAGTRVAGAAGGAGGLRRCAGKVPR
jgi:hypothetical protein